MKKGVLALIVLIGIFAINGCSNKGESEIHVKDNNIKIGMIFDTFVVERWQRDRDVFVSKARELGAEVNVQNANGDINKQISQIEYFIDLGVDVIVIVSIDSIQLKGVIEKAKSKGIKIIAYDRLILNSDIDLYISFDNTEVGRLMAEALSSSLKPGDKVVMVGGPTNDNNVSYIGDAFQEEITKSKVEIIDRINLEEWKAELAGEYVNKNFSTIGEVQGIMCGNDNLAGEVIRVLSENRLAGKVLVVGQDADLEACQRIVEGTQYATVFKPLEHMASIAAQYAVQLANGNEIQIINTINNGKYDVPYVSLQPWIVNFENMEEIIIDSGYHLREDVYINRPDLLKQP